MLNIWSDKNYFMKTGLVNQSNFMSLQPASAAAFGRSQEYSRRAEYLLVIFPYGELQDRLLDEQQQFSSEYGLQTTNTMSGGPAGLAQSGNKPHITVAAFQAGE